MVTLRALGLTILAGLSLAAPLESRSHELVERQNNIWNDKYIQKPYAEAVQDLGNCEYQLTFRRDGFDSRNNIRFYVTYSGSTTRTEIVPISGSYTISPTGIADYGLYTVPNNYVISVHRFRGACNSRGAKPNAFYVRSTLGDGYTYRNDYISPAVTPSTTVLPAPPTNVRVTRTSTTSKSYQVQWTASSGATGGYLILARIDVYAYELSGYLPGTRTIPVAAGITSGNFTITGRDLLSSVAVVSRAGSDVISDVTKVPIIPAPA